MAILSASQYFQHFKTAVANLTVATRLSQIYQVFFGSSTKPPVAYCNFTVGAETSNAIIVTGQLVDGTNTNLTEVTSVDWFLSNTSPPTGVATAPGSTVSFTTGWGTQWVSKLSGALMTNTTGQFALSMTETSTLSLYMNVRLPSGKIVTSAVATWT